ncbi:sensor histidine kinase [Janthinobacterium psychrotolerans]|uniref:Oxygen sensor histidine kinase NreB n=1 Tax=Janthinobacterium psychrotolerans TaxID=1747903 RepID=A0A1A7BZ89_9BURK|nr:sensor histidine kinase [Janthinobacterium psychrotolerans]OBV38822.1 Signal transduction histidine kinase [Janthinobacterium psychrotolerans]
MPAASESAYHLVNLLVICAGLLGAVALLLLWRLRGLYAQMRDEQLTLQQAEHALHLARRQIGQLAADRLHIQARERRRLGRDLHDDLGQYLLTLKLDVANLQANVNGATSRLAPTLQCMASNIDQGIAALRCVIAGLRPPALEQGPQAALHQLLAEFTRATGIPVQHAFELADAHQASLGLHETVMYRALQEALANVARHAHATQVHVRLQCQGAMLQLYIADNGIGMKDVHARQGCGLAGMEERLREAGGVLRMVSRRGRGTTLQLSLPIKARYDAMPARIA